MESRNLNQINKKKITLATNLFFAAAARSRWRRFLNQFPTCVGVRPVAWASSRFFVGFGYGSWRYHSRSKLRVRSLKQCVFCSPSQIVRGSGNFFRTRYLSTGPGRFQRQKRGVLCVCVIVCVTTPSRIAASGLSGYWSHVKGSDFVTGDENGREIHLPAAIKSVAAKVHVDDVFR